jgi:hypothetical protein
MAWFVGSLLVTWYTEAGCEGDQAHRHRPWYQHKETPTFADMLATCRLQLWQHWLEQESDVRPEREDKWAWLLEYVATAT